jgi:flagellin-like protein
MKTLRKIRKSAKALSPVVASIILIAVTVAVSIAVAAWMGALTVGFMGTEELKITGVTFPSAGNCAIAMQNTGTGPLTITEIHIANGANLLTSSVTIQSNANTTQTVSFAWVNGNNYAVKVLTSKGNTFMYTAYAPS